MRILCIGLNHKTADVALREKLAFDAKRGRRALRQLKRKWPEGAYVVLSTCNRVEVYVVRPVHAHPRSDELRHWIGDYRSVEISEYESALYNLFDADAVRHLFSVAAGLDSLVPGEAQIVSQLRGAYDLALETAVTSDVMNELFQTALRVAKQIRTETNISRGKVSVGSVGVDCVTKTLRTLRGKCVLSVGAGKMNSLMIRRLIELGAGRIIVCNRSIRRARELAKTCDGEVVHFDRLGQVMQDCDVVLASTGSESPIITRKMIVSVQRHRRWTPLLIVDIAVPRDVEASAGTLKNVSLYNIDDLERTVRKNLRGRRTQKGRAEKIISHHVDEFISRVNIRGVVPTIEQLYEHVQRIADRELTTARNKLRTHTDAEADTEIVRMALHRAIRRILHPCVTNLRKEARTDSARAHVASLRKLFNLDK